MYIQVVSNIMLEVVIMLSLRVMIHEGPSLLEGPWEKHHENVSNHSM